MNQDRHQKPAPEQQTLARKPAVDAPSARTDETLVRADETLARPDEQHADKAHTEETLARSDETLARSDETLVRSDETLVRADETLARPDKAHMDETLARSDDGPSGSPKPSSSAQTLPLESEGGGGGREAPSEQLKRFGDYDLLSVIAKGGMGVVYKARQRKLNRIVAIKMILAGQLADRTDVERFYIEAEAAANLKHPNIVSIYEIGEVDGQHFFSMEYIAGASLSDLTRERPLDPRMAAEYVKQIADAMHYAHEQGILHRDLKPSNVLIDGEGRLLVTDFGLAKRVDTQSQLTMTGTIVGTPSYMPPEQARGDIEQIGVASDVYSTGAILYEMLTRVPPFLAANPFETIRQVLTAEPSAPRMINSMIPVDLETICLKSLQKEIGRRYATEKELRDELERFLTDQPILARPTGAVERAWRWCRRNKLIASLAGAAALCFALAFVGITVGYFQATAGWRQAEQSDRESRATVDELFTRVSEDDLLNQPGMQALRHDLLRRALTHYQKFVDRSGDDPALRSELAKTYFRVGYITNEIQSPADAAPWYEKALSLQQSGDTADNLELAADLGDTWNGLGVVRQKMGDHAGAADAYRAAIEVRTRVAETLQDDLAAQRKLANSMMNMGMLDQQRGDGEEARDMMLAAQAIRARQLERQESFTLRRDYAVAFYNLGMLEQDAGALPAAGEHFAAAEDQFVRLLSDAPDDLGNQWRMATCLRSHADLDAAQLDPQRTTACEHVLGRYAAAAAHLERLALRNPDVTEYQASWAGVLMNQGYLEQRFQQNDKALASFQTASKVLQRILDGDSSNHHARRNLAKALCEQSVQLALAGQTEEANGRWEASKALVDELPVATPDPYASERARVSEIGGWLDGIKR